MDKVRCTKCGKRKPRSAFAISRRRKNGLQGWCRDCNSEAMRQWRKNSTPDMRQLSVRKRLERTYNITWDEFHELLIAQSGLCAICELPLKKLMVDHCHETGKVRGLLCLGCNTAIGLLLDDLGVIRNAYRYLKRHLP